MIPAFEYREELINKMYKRIKVEFREWISQRGFWELKSNIWMIAEVEGAVYQLLEKKVIRNAFGDVREKLPSHTLILHGPKGCGKRTIARLACEWLVLEDSTGSCEYCESALRAWRREMAFPDIFRTVDLLVLSEFWAGYVPQKYVIAMKNLLEERKWEGKVTILTCNNVIDIKTRSDDFFAYLCSDMSERKAGIIVDVDERKDLMRKTNDYFQIDLPECAINQLASIVNGTSGDIINLKSVSL